MIDIKNPIHLTFISLVVTFLFSVGIIYLARPSWVMKLDNKGKETISTLLLLSYSITFALILSIAVLVLKSDNKSRNPFVSEAVVASYSA